MVTSTDGSETKTQKAWFHYSEHDEATQSDVDYLESRLDEQGKATSTRTDAIKFKSEGIINTDEGASNATESTTAVNDMVPQTTTRCSGGSGRASQHFGDHVTGKVCKSDTPL